MNNKKIHRVMTRAVAEKYNPLEQIALSEAFQLLIRSFPQERHFIIGFAYANEGQGEKVWLIIDESDTERIETMLFPDDY
ncbi:MAG TPA: hypothetical protein PKZ29_02100 [Candidatus Woesebacteria bacterium]|nr:hypothetical protein [Candidatus Woesebacteria bacterium]